MSKLNWNSDENINETKIYSQKVPDEFELVILMNIYH
jgi:hypothetical protein